MSTRFNPVRRAWLAAIVTLLSATAALAGAAPGGASGSAPRAAAASDAGELVVGFRGGVAPAERRAARDEAGVRHLRAVGPHSQVVKVGRQAGAAARALAANPAVSYVKPNYVARASAFAPNDPGRGGPGRWIDLQWNFLDETGIRVQGAWQNAIDSGAPGGRGVLVAVLDTGVAYRTSKKRRYRKAPDLDRRRFVSGHDFVRNNRFPYDRNGHGTFVAGTIAQATNNGIGVTGIAYNARIMPVRVLDFEGKGDVAAIARGIRFAARRGADVINMSFEFDIGLTASQIPDVISAIRYAHRKGAVLVGAAGNAEDTRVAYPALARHVIAVGATTEHGCLADYSNTGYGLDIVAPGGGADAAVPGDPACKGLDQIGRDVFQYTFSGFSFRRFGLPSGYEGTSMAVPHVSGVVALVLGARLLGPRPSPEAVAAKLARTARDFGPPGYDPLYGVGLLDAAAATARTPEPQPPPAPPPPPPTG